MEKVDLRPARSEDYCFALELYLTTMEPHTAELMTWDEQKQRTSFSTQWCVADAQVIVSDGHKIGWVQVQETDAEIFLQQFFIAPDLQRQGFGSRVLEILITGWRAAQKPVELYVLKNSPARRLYERFGFVVAGDEGIKVRMSMAP